MVEELGKVAIVAGSGAQALEVLHHRQIDVVVTDQGMPQMTGLQLAEKIRETWPELPVILASGFVELPAEARDPRRPYAAVKRSTFRGDLALKLDLATTRKTAPQAHTIAKNLLDLLGARQTDVPWPKRSLLYGDDRQIQALSVACRHGEAQPSISIEARPFATMLDNLEFAATAVRAAEMNMQAYREQELEGAEQGYHELSERSLLRRADSGRSSRRGQLGSKGPPHP